MPVTRDNLPKFLFGLIGKPADRDVPYEDFVRRVSLVIRDSRQSKLSVHYPNGIAVLE